LGRYIYFFFTPIEPNHLARSPSLRILQANDIAGMAAASGRPEHAPPISTLTKRTKQQLRHDILMRR
jgi:hypothetical protein